MRAGRFDQHTQPEAHGVVGQVAPPEVEAEDLATRLRLVNRFEPGARCNRPDPDTSVILFWMWGGPSQFETYDPKPDAPAESWGPFRPIPTFVPGMDLCELFPLHARLADRIALVRSLHHEMSAHNNGSIEVLTGPTRLPRPSPTTPTSAWWPAGSGASVLTACPDRKVLIVAAGEFGRTPRLTHAGGLIGRDHWLAAQSALVSGGGLRVGQVIGATNRRGGTSGGAPADAEGLAGDDLPAPGDRPPGRISGSLGPPDPDPARRRADPGVCLKR